MAEMLTRRYIITFFVIALLSTGVAQAATLLGAGSDTMRRIFESLSAKDAQAQTGLDVRYLPTGSNRAAAELAAGRVDFVAMSRRMSAAEQASIVAGARATLREVIVGMDALAIYVHKSNTLRGLSMQQLEAIYAAELACDRGWFASRKTIARWDDLAFSDLGAIRLAGRAANSGTHDYFRDSVLCGGNFRSDITVLPDSAGVIDAVAADPAAIGYAGIGFRDSRVKALPLSADNGDLERPFYPYVVDRYADSDDLEKRYGWVHRGKYPLARPLYVYFLADEGPADSTHDLVSFLLSAAGQDLVHSTGFIPLPRKALQRQVQRLGQSEF